MTNKCVLWDQVSWSETSGLWFLIWKILLNFGSNKIMSLVFCWLCNSQDLQVNWSLDDSFVTSINFWLFFMLTFLVSYFRCIRCLPSTLHSLTFVHWWQNQIQCSIMMILTCISSITYTIKRHSIMSDHLNGLVIVHCKQTLNYWPMQ